MTRPLAADPDGARRGAPPQRRRRLTRVVRDALRPSLPMVVSLLSVGLLFGLLFGVDFLFGADVRVFGVSDQATEKLVFTRYGRLIVTHQLRILALYLATGLTVGALLQPLLSLWENSAVWPRRRPAHSAATPVDLPPTPWSTRRRLLLSLGLGLLIHLFLLGRTLVARPALYSEALYDRGGFARTLMLSLTHGRLVWLGLTVAVGLTLFLFGAPLLTVRGRCYVGALARRRRLWAVAALLLLLLGGLRLGLPGDEPPAPGAVAAAASRPSILLIAIDSLRADRVGPQARHITPTISGLAERSVAFDAAHVTVPRTFPSLVTLLSGRYPHHHGIRTMFPSLRERAGVPPALPRLLHPAGYLSSVLSDFCGEVFSRIDLGYDRTQVPGFDARTIVFQRSLTVHKNILPYALGPLGPRLFPELGSLAELADAQQLAGQALTELADLQRRGSPFFMTVFFSSAHFPYAAPAPYYRRYTDPNYRGPFRYNKPPLSEPQSSADLAQVNALYDGAVAATDDGVRQLLEGLGRLGLAEKTIVILLADHGENLYDEPQRGMGHGEHLEGDNALRVPLLLYDPVHHFPAHHVPGLVRDIDVLPTLLDILELPPATAGELDGVSLRPLLEGRQTSLGLSAFHETELWFTPSGPGFAEGQRLPYPAVTATTVIDDHDDIALTDRYAELVTVAKHRALRSERWKIIYRPTREGPRYSLYDVQADPRELHDVAATEPAVLATMQAALFRLVAQDPHVVIEHGYILPR